MPITLLLSRPGAAAPWLRDHASLPRAGAASLRPFSLFPSAPQARSRGPPGSETTPPSPVLELLASDVIMEHLVVIGLADVRVRAQVARTLQGMLQCGGAGVNSGEKAIFRVTH